MFWYDAGVKMENAVAVMASSRLALDSRIGIWVVDEFQLSSLSGLDGA